MDDIGTAFLVGLDTVCLAALIGLLAYWGYNLLVERPAQPDPQDNEAFNTLNTSYNDLLGVYLDLDMKHTALNHEHALLKTQQYQSDQLLAGLKATNLDLYATIDRLREAAELRRF